MYIHVFVAAGKFPKNFLPVQGVHQLGRVGCYILLQVGETEKKLQFITFRTFLMCSSMMDLTFLHISGIWFTFHAFSSLYFRILQGLNLLHIAICRW
jgi:hypothetical protein